MEDEVQTKKKHEGYEDSSVLKNVDIDLDDLSSSSFRTTVFN